MYPIPSQSTLFSDHVKRTRQTAKVIAKINKHYSEPRSIDTVDLTNTEGRFGIKIKNTQSLPMRHVVDIVGMKQHLANDFIDDSIVDG